MKNYKKFNSSHDQEGERIFWNFFQNFFSHKIKKNKKFQTQAELDSRFTKRK